MITLPKFCFFFFKPRILYPLSKTKSYVGNKDLKTTSVPSGPLISWPVLPALEFFQSHAPDCVKSTSGWTVPSTPIVSPLPLGSLTPWFQCAGSSAYFCRMCCFDPSSSGQWFRVYGRMGFTFCTGDLVLSLFFSSSFSFSPTHIPRNFEIWNCYFFSRNTLLRLTSRHADKSWLGFSHLFFKQGHQLG